MDPGSVKEINVGFKLTQAMLSKQVDATLGAFWNYEGVDLAAARQDPEILRMEDLGVPTYDELIFVARRADLDEQGGSQAAPLPAGHGARPRAAARTDPGRASTRCWRPTRASTAGSRRPPCKATLPVFFPEDDERPFGCQDPASGPPTSAGCATNDLLKQPAGERAPLTNEFLPGEGLDPGTSGLE